MIDEKFIAEPLTKEKFIKALDEIKKNTLQPLTNGKIIIICNGKIVL